MFLIRSAFRVPLSWSDKVFLNINNIFTNLIDLIFLPLQSLIGQKRMAYVFILPNMLVFGIFILLPMLLNFYYSFTSGQSILLENRDYVGTQNLERIFTCEDFREVNSCQEDLFWRGARNTFWFVWVQVSSMIILATMTALALNGKVAFRGFFRSVFFYPVLLSPVVVALIWKWFLDFDTGLLNAFLEDLGYGRISFLTNSDWAQFWVVVVSDWAQMGFYTLILLAGLQSIPASLYEAAEIDGASVFNRFRFITIPLLMPTMTVVLVLALIRAVQVFDQVYVLTGGGPGTAALYMVQYIFREGFTERNYGGAAAASLLLASTLLLLTLTQLFFARRSEAT